jgi:L-rhamnose mutarotase
MERIAFTMRVKRGLEAEYRERHREVWPEMVQALKKAGCTNYSIYMDGQDLFAYMEVDSFSHFKSHMSGSPGAQRWEAHMAPIMERVVQPETGFHKVLAEVFHLD